MYKIKTERLGLLNRSNVIMHFFPNVQSDDKFCVIKETILISLLRPMKWKTRYTNTSIQIFPKYLEQRKV